jgi:phytoene dehydrogenase-like protein
MTVNVALSEQLALPLHQPGRTDLDLRRPTLMTGTLDALLDAAGESMRGTFTAQPPWWATIFNAVDPSQAPEGQDIVDLYCPAVPGKPHGGWDEHREPAANRLVEQAGAVLAGLTESELGRYIETPADRAERVGTRNGCLYHVDFLPSRVGPLRPALGFGGYRTPVKRLYLSGIGTHPPAGVSGLNGKQTAATVLRDLRQGGRPPRHRPSTAAARPPVNEDRERVPAAGRLMRPPVLASPDGERGPA